MLGEKKWAQPNLVTEISINVGSDVIQFGQLKILRWISL